MMNWRRKTKSLKVSEQEKRFPFFLLAFISIVCVISCNDQKTKNEFYHYQIIGEENGYGYKVFGGDKLIIQQKFIPSVVGMQYFKSEEEAGQVATVAIEKIKKGKLPTIKTEELDSLGIKYVETRRK